MYVGHAKLLAFSREPKDTLYMEVLYKRYKNRYSSTSVLSDYGIIYGPEDLNINTRVQYVAQISDVRYDRVDWESLIKNHVRRQLPCELCLTHIYDFYENLKLWPAFLSALSKLDNKFNIDMQGSYIGRPSILPLFSFEGSPYKLELAFENEDDLRNFEIILKDAFSQAEFDGA